MLIETSPRSSPPATTPRGSRGTELAQREPLDGGTVAALRPLGYNLTRFHEEGRSGCQHPDETRALVLGSGIPVVRMLRTTYTGERAVSVDEAILAADRHVIVSDYTV